jgi:hypothetical protein
VREAARAGRAVAIRSDQPLLAWTYRRYRTGDERPTRVGAEAMVAEYESPHGVSA